MVPDADGTRIAVAVLKGIAGHDAFPDQRVFPPFGIYDSRAPAAADVSEFTYSDQRFVGYICRAAPDTRMLAPGSEVISARSRDGTPMSSP